MASATAEAAGPDAYAQFRRTLQQLIDELRADRSERPGHRAGT